LFKKGKSKKKIPEGERCLKKTELQVKSVGENNRPGKKRAVPKWVFLHR